MENPSESIFINRELSWLDFDSRVLALAKEKSVPLAERIKFAAIFGSNMDEFFMVRVGSLYDQTLLKNNKLDIVTHMTPSEQIAAITPRVAELQAKCDKYYQHLLSALKENKYIKVDFDHLDKQQEHYWKAYFTSEILPNATRSRSCAIKKFIMPPSSTARVTVYIMALSPSAASLSSCCLSKIQTAPQALPLRMS